MDVLSARDILERLVAFPTVSHDSNLPLIDWVEGYLAGHGIPSHRNWNEDRQKAALFAHVGPMEPDGVVLSGHTDVVPVEGQDWASDPWTLTEREGRLYGRGTCDMKGFVAHAIAAMVAAHRRGLRRPMQLALSYDEELGCVGAPPMIAAMQSLLPKASVAVIGEPSKMTPINGHKGSIGYLVHVRGYEVHSSLLPYGVSAVMEAARLIQWLNERNAAIQARTITPMAAPFHPPFSTLHVGIIHGGTADNITAGDCRFPVEIRAVPGEDIDALGREFEAEAARVQAAMQAVRPEAAVNVVKEYGFPMLRPEVEGAAEALVRRLTGQNDTGVVSYGTEAGQFQDAGYSAIVCGPGDIAQAHKADEYLEISEFEAAGRFMQALIEELA